jgi:hypothetical protein
VNIEELFADTVEVQLDYRNSIVIYTYRNPTAEEWLQYQQRSANFKIAGKELKGTPDSLGARSWLHDKLRTRVEAVLPDGEQAGVRQEIEDRFPPFVKDHAIVGFLSQVQLRENQGN